MSWASLASWPSVADRGTMSPCPRSANQVPSVARAKLTAFRRSGARQPRRLAPTLASHLRAPDAFVSQLTSHIAKRSLLRPPFSPADPLKSAKYAS